MAAEKIRESLIAGTWYPGDPGNLKRQINGYLAVAAPPPVDGEIVGLISPHAGYMYSGGIAAFAYKLLLKNPFERVLILAPSHHAHFSGASIYNLGGYRTPLGVVPLDHEVIDGLFARSSILKYAPQAEQREHSLEIQLPFLQTVLPKFVLTPVIIGDQSYANCLKLSEVIAEVCRDKRVLLVASTDLSHYHGYEGAVALDKLFLEHVEAFDPEGLADDIREHRCEACGAGPVVTLLLAAAKLGATRAKVLQYANSGDVTGDRSGVVGYMAGAVYRNSEGRLKTGGEPPREGGTDLGFSPDEKETLRKIAYHAIRSRCMGEPMPEIPTESPRLGEPRGAFVCIHKGGELRGCIGTIEPRIPLSETIRKMAVEAAFGDPRFCALAAGELEEIHIEISVLTPLQALKEKSQIEIGRHGLYIRKGFHSGLLLPQVAVEHGWGSAEFLEWTCRKAGLPVDAWEDPHAEVYIFSADVF